uniref:Uncharacterized protein n=1 Tax=Acrobeloides nanus TaxID=290746 RepID=A0A914CQN3_9BILA
MDANENGPSQLKAETGDVEMEAKESDPSQLDAEYMAFESLLDEPGTSHDDGIPFPDDYDFMSYEELLDVPLPFQEESRVVLKLKKVGSTWKVRSTMNMKPKSSCDILLYCICYYVFCYSSSKPNSTEKPIVMLPIAFIRHQPTAACSERHRIDLINNLVEDEAFVLMDWIQKWLPAFSRETQAQYFGKKQISWHCADDTTVLNGKKVHHSFIHVMEE